IIIAADGYLHYLPFEGLLTQRIKPDGVEDFGRWPYLAKKYHIGYIPSASILHQLQNQKKPIGGQKKILVFADPIYPSEQVKNQYETRGTETLVRLPYSSQEAADVATIMGKEKSDLFLREQASEDNFKYKVKLDDYKIIHMAAHGIVNENKPQFSAIALTRSAGSQEDGYLQMFEVFNLNLNADLV